MQSFGALLLAAAVAGAAPAGPGPVATVGAPAAEAYVAELDADWNVKREIRVACPTQAGCAVDLALDDPTMAAVHVRFDPMRAGSVAVRSRLEDRAGRASSAEEEVLALDRAGFAAGHYEARMAASGSDGRIILMAVRVPGWTGPGVPGPLPASDRT